METEATKWHKDRQQQITEKYPDILTIPRYNPFCLITILLIPILHLTMAYSAQYFSLLTVIILAWSIGGFFVYYQFNNSHELCHNLVHPKIKGKIYDIILHYATLPAVNPNFYLFAKYGHVKSHHASLAGQTVSEAVDFLNTEDPDIELLHDRYYYELHFKPNEGRKLLLPFVYNNKFLRIIFTFFIIPIVGAIIYASIILPIVTYSLCIRSIFIKKSPAYTEKAKSLGIHLTLIFLIMALLYYFAGPFALLYLFIAEASYRGLFFGPGLIFVLATHKTTYGKNGEIQPTCSVYGKFISFWLYHSNYHVEHHDFPSIPRKYLPQVTAKAPEYYKSLFYFNGITDTFFNYCKSRNWIYGGQR